MTAALKRDLAAIAKRDPALAKGALAMTALQLAGRIDDPGNSATSVSMCARSLLEVMGRLLELSPAEERSDLVDELQRRRARRRAS